MSLERLLSHRPEYPDIRLTCGNELGYFRANGKVMLLWFFLGFYLRAFQRHLGGNFGKELGYRTADN